MSPNETGSTSAGGSVNDVGFASGSDSTSNMGPVDATEGCAPIAEENAYQTPFFSVLNTAHVDQVPLAPLDLWERADVVIRGCIVAAAEGRWFDFVEGASNPIHTVVFELEALSQVKGDAVSERAYFELIRGGAAISQYREALGSAPEVLLFLRASRELSSETMVTFNEGAGYPADETLYSLVHVEGIVVMTPLGPEQPIADVAPEFQIREVDLGDAGAVTTLEQLGSALAEIWP